MTAVRDMGRIIKEASQADPMGPGKLVVFANAVEDNPFMAGAFHGVGEADVVINVGVSGPGVVQRAVEKVPGESFDVLAETVKRPPSKSHVLVSWLVKWPVNVLVLSSVL